jgi:hypothetical protein
VGKMEDLAALYHSIKDGEGRLKAIKVNLDALDREIESLLALKNVLVSNIQVLKLKGVVPMASEFKKAKEDLIKTKFRLVFCNSNRDGYRRAYLEGEMFHKQTQEKYAELLKTGINNVLRVKFGRKNG